MKIQSMTIDIRKVNLNDLNIVYQMICQLENDTLDFDGFKNAFIQNLNHENVCYYIAQTGQDLIGFISVHVQFLIHHAGEVAEIQEFYVDQNHRGKGIGKKLMAEVFSFLKNKSIASIEVSSNKKRIENVAIYEQLGFRLTHNKLTISM